MFLEQRLPDAGEPVHTPNIPRLVHREERYRNGSLKIANNSILFDEKMGDTFHLALGRAYDACLPEGEEGNE